MGNVTFLGVEGSGKSVLTMALIQTFREHGAQGWSLVPESNAAFRFLERMPQTLTAETLPAQTTALRYLSLSVRKDGVVQRTLDILDYPGEIYRLAFLEAKDASDPEAFEAQVSAYREEIRAMLGHLVASEQIFVLFNMADGVDLAHNQRNSDAVWVTRACLKTLFELEQRPQVTLLLTQIDRYVPSGTEVFDPKVFLAKNLPLIANSFPGLDVLGVSVLGDATARLGLDNMILRCLAETPFCKGAMEAAESATRNAPVRLLNVFAVGDKPAAEALQKEIAAYTLAQERCQACWFVSDSQLIEAGMRFPRSVASDFRVLAAFARSYANGMLNMPKRAEYAQKAKVRLILSAELQSPEGQVWKKEAIRRLDAFSKSVSMERWGTPRSIIFFIIVWILVIAFCSVVSVLIASSTR